MVSFQANSLILTVSLHDCWNDQPFVRLKTNFDINFGNTIDYVFEMTLYVYGRK